jgi:hypothetical protein
VSPIELAQFFEAFPHGLATAYYLWRHLKTQLACMASTEAVACTASTEGDARMVSTEVGVTAALGLEAGGAAAAVAECTALLSRIEAWGLTFARTDDDAMAFEHE